jgi:ribosomal protein S27E
MTSEKLKCPGCGAELNESDGSLRLGFMLVGRREIVCPGCGAELVATASLSFGDSK